VGATLLSAGSDEAGAVERLQQLVQAADQLAGSIG
jgi:hypothetical protein